MPGIVRKPIFFRPISLRARLLLGVSSMFIPLLLLGVGVLFSVQYLGAAFEEALDDPVNEMHEIMNLQAQITLAANPPNDYLIHGEVAEREKFSRLAANVNLNFTRALKLVSLWPEQKALIEAARTEWLLAQKIATFLLDLSAPVADPAAAAAMKRMDVHIDRVLAILLKAHEITRNELDEQSAYVRTLQHKTVLWIIGAIGLLSLLVVTASGFMLARFVLTPIAALRDGAINLGAGNYAYRVRVETGDELEQLAKTFNAMAEELEKDYARLEELSTHDGLTGLYNHRAFHKLLSEELARASRFQRPLSVLMLDIDHFKRVNDTYGHQAGDAVLKGLCGLVDVQSRTIDRVCRYGGEEIMVILPEVDMQAAMFIAERLRKSVEQSSFEIGKGQTVEVTVSIGVASYPLHANAQEGLIHAADTALYAAKKAGRNQARSFQLCQDSNTC